MNIYYHIIEDGQGLFAWHGYRHTEKEATAKIHQLFEFFPGCLFYYEVYPTKKPPNYINGYRTMDSVMVKK